MDFLNVFTMLLSIISFLGLSGMIFVTHKNIAKILEHSPEILFGYYSKMKVYLLELKTTLGQETETPLMATLVDCNLSEEDEPVKKLQDIIDKIIVFFKTQDWQIPLDFEFEEALSKLLVEIMYLEKGNFCKCFSKEDEVKTKYREMVDLIDKLTNKISKKQEKIAEETEKSQETISKKVKRWFEKIKNREQKWYN